MATTTNFGWETPDDTDLVKDGAAAMRTLGGAIDTSLVDLKGGTTGQNLRKATNTDMDFTWAGDATNTVIDAEGDLLVGDSADTLQRLAIGTTGQVLTVDTTIDGKIKWAAAAGGGKVLQVVNATTSTATTISTTTYTDTTITATITPTANTSKILILVSSEIYATRAGEKVRMGSRLLRDATTITTWARSFGVIPSTLGSPQDLQIETIYNLHYLDSPATTSAITYKIQGNHDEAGITTTWQKDSTLASITLLEIGA